MHIDIITNNFFRMMRSGAMNEYVDIEPMSAFKWSRLLEVVKSQDVASVALRAAKNHQFEANFNMPQPLRDQLQQEAGKTSAQNIHLVMKNGLLNKKLKQIHTLERHAEDCSMVSLQLFDIIVANCQAMLNDGTSTRLIIQLGNFIRINGDKVDYKKISKWLSQITMTRVAGLVGSILITNFAFRKEEVPFVKNVDKKAAAVMMECICQRKEESHNRGITYFEYAPLENASIILGRLHGRLDKIEE